MCHWQACSITTWLGTLLMIDTVMTSSNGNIFHVTGHLCGEFTDYRWIPRTKASDADLLYFLDPRINKRLSKQSWGWWFETPSRPSWRHSNDLTNVLRWCINILTNIRREMDYLKTHNPISYIKITERTDLILDTHSTWDPFYSHGQTLIPAQISISSTKCRMKLLMHSQTSTAQPLESGNW